MRLKRVHAHEFLLPISIDGFAYHMSTIEYHNVFRYCLTISIFYFDEVCHVCFKSCQDIHTVYCKELSCFKYHYDFFMDVNFDIFSRTRVFINKEGTCELLDRPKRGKIDT